MAPLYAHLLLHISFFYGVCGGIVLSLHPRHLIDSGGNFFLVGLLHTMIYICEKFRTDLLALLGRGKKFELKFSLCCCFFAFFTMVFFNSLPIFFLVRALYALSVHITLTIKDLIRRTEEGEEYQNMLCSVVDVSKSFGISTGALLGGLLYDTYHDLSTNVMVSSCFALLCLLLLQKTDNDDSHLPVKEESHLELLLPSAFQQLQKLKNYEFKDNWNNFLLKSAYITVFTIYFSRIAQLLFFNHQLTTICVGYTIAYEKIVGLLSKCLVPFIRNRWGDPKTLMDHCILTSGFLLGALYFAPSYGCCLLLFALVSLVYYIVMSLLADDVLDLTKNPELLEISETLSSIVNIMLPVIAGTVCYVLHGFLLEMVTIMPLAVYVVVVSRVYLRKKKEEKME